jgi:hypothetical protein
LSASTRRSSWTAQQLYVNGLVPAVFVGAAVVAVASLVAMGLPRLSAVRSGIEPVDGATALPNVSTEQPELAA